MESPTAHPLLPPALRLLQTSFHTKWCGFQEQNNTVNVRVTWHWLCCSCNCCWSRKVIRIIYYVCVCTMRFPACNAHALYCQLWPAPFHSIFPHYLKRHDFFFLGGGGVIQHEVRFDCLHNILCETCHYEENWAWRYQKCILLFM